jgi:hypothetical protein
MVIASKPARQEAATPVTNVRSAQAKVLDRRSRPRRRRIADFPNEYEKSRQNTPIVTRRTPMGMP